MKVSKTFADKIDDSERLATAKRRTARLVDHVSTLFTLHEANRFVIYSDTLSKQIPRSYAANAFAQFQMSMHLFELVRLGAIWDSPAKDRESIPTILALIDKAAIIDTIAASTHHFYAHELTAAHLTQFQSPEHEAAYKQWWESERRSRAAHETAKVRSWLANARQAAEAVLTSSELEAMRDFRNGYVAHNLSIPNPAPDTPNDVPRVKYGDERKILKETVKIADCLHLALNGSSYDWDRSREIAARNARDLCTACRFDNVATRRSSARESKNFILDHRLINEEIFSDDEETES